MDRRTPPSQQDLELISRRRLLRRGAQLGALAAVPSFLAACGSDDGDDSASSGTTQTTTTAAKKAITGTIALRTYPGWIGDKEAARFAAKYPGAKVKEVADTSSGVAETVALLNRSKGDFDLTLAGLVTGGQLDAAGLLQKVGPEQVPNLKNMPAKIVEAFPLGVPGDLGKTVFGYRKDLISEKPTSWADFWELSAKYKNKVTAFKYDVDVTGVALLYKGHDVNSTDQAELDEAKDALIELKGNLRALLATDHTKPLAAGDAVMAMAYDYDLAATAGKDDNIVIVTPTEGTPAYIEGWCALKDSTKLDTVYALMDEHLAPKNYANYINTIGAAYLMPSAEPYIKSAIKTNPGLKYDEAAIDRVGFEKYLGPEATAARSKMWDAVLSA